MRWRALVVVRLGFAHPRAADELAVVLRRSVAARVDRLKVLHVDPPGNPQFAYLRIHGHSSRLSVAGRDLAGLISQMRSDLGATSAEIVHWGARRRGIRGRRHTVGGGPVGGGGPGNGGSGSAGVREPRRPLPPGFPPMQAARDLNAD